MNTSAPNRSKQNLRLDANLWLAIDEARNKRAGSISRNTWITEAILEKLAKDQNPVSSIEEGRASL
jgi:hypothetical protein